MCGNSVSALTTLEDLLALCDADGQRVSIGLGQWFVEDLAREPNRGAIAVELHVTYRDAVEQRTQKLLIGGKLDADLIDVSSQHRVDE